MGSEAPWSCSDGECPDLSFLRAPRVAPASPLPHPSSALLEDGATPPCWALEESVPEAAQSTVSLPVPGVRLLVPGL